MSKLSLLPLVAALLAAPAAFAQDIDCDNAMVQSDITACAAEDFKSADGDLNETYAQAVEAMKEIDSYQPEGDRGAEEALRVAQRAWLPYRDATCAAEGWTMHGGTMEQTVVYGCLADVTRARTEALRTLFEQN
jgi:uncharacterized protein YecT (DUF1311 family)